jgi:hypothetical protein
MDAKKALELLSPIPSKEFTTDRYSDGVGRCCSVGHLNRITSKDPNNYHINNCSIRDYRSDSGIRDLIEDVYNFTNRKIGCSVSIITINDNGIEVERLPKKLQRKTPKGRVLAILRELAKEQSKQ